MLSSLKVDGTDLVFSIQKLSKEMKMDKNEGLTDSLDVQFQWNSNQFEVLTVKRRAKNIHKMIKLQTHMENRKDSSLQKAC